VPPFLPEGLRLLFVGINPGLWTAAAQAHFARPGNRFWPAVHRAGLLPHVVDASAGLDPGDAALLTAAGIGITNLVHRATARADELTRAELATGASELRATVRATRPRVVAVLGLTAARRAGLGSAGPGRVAEPFEGAVLWVVPNPSGLNAHETVDSLAAWYRAAAADAGLVCHGPSA
jgi:TDG/mug DNA glycosylase family protein